MEAEAPEEGAWKLVARHKRSCRSIREFHQVTRSLGQLHEWDGMGRDTRMKKRRERGKLTSQLFGRWNILRNLYSEWVAAACSVPRCATLRWL